MLSESDDVADVHDRDPTAGQHQSLELLRGAGAVLSVEGEIHSGVARERVEQGHDVASTVAGGTRREVPGTGWRGCACTGRSSSRALEELGDRDLATREFDEC